MRPAVCVRLYLLLVCLACAGKETWPERGAPVVPVVQVTVAQPSASAWQIGFLLPEAVEVVRFVRPYKHRVERWRVAEAGLELRRDGEHDLIRRTDGKKLGAFTLTIAPYAQKPGKDSSSSSRTATGGCCCTPDTSTWSWASGRRRGAGSCWCRGHRRW
jgi:hypothetical protein